MRRRRERRGVERRQNPGRRDDDPSKIEELTWQEACGHDRKVIRLLQEGYENFTRGTVIALAVLAVFVGVALWRDYVLAGQNAQRIKDIAASRFDAAVQQCRQQRASHIALVTYLDRITSAKQKAGNPNFNAQVQGFAQTIDPSRKNCIKYATAATATPPTAK